MVGGHVYSPAEPFATALLIQDRVIAWIGTDAGAEVHVADVDTVVDLGGDLVAPGFVHLAETNPPAEGGFVHGERTQVPVADRWVGQAWDNAAAQPLAVVPRDPCRLRSRVAAGTPTALVPSHGTHNGWEVLRAAVHGVAAEEALTARAAFSALTRGAWRLLGHSTRGVLEVGSDATFAQWAVTDLLIETPDERISNWSTDPRATTPGLPPLDGTLPGFRRLWREGMPSR